MMALPRFQSRRRLIFISHRGKNVPASEDAITFNNKSGAGSPVGTSTPDYVGQSYLNTTPPLEFWVATGLTNADWSQLI